MKHLVLAAVLAVASIIPQMAQADQPTSLLAFMTLHGEIPPTATGILMKTFPSARLCEKALTYKDNPALIQKEIAGASWGLSLRPGYGAIGLCVPATQTDVANQLMRQQMGFDK